MSASSLVIEQSQAGRVSRAQKHDVVAATPRSAVHLPLWVSSLLALVAGALLGLAFQPWAIWFTAPLGVALLCWLTRQPTARRAAWSGFLAGLVMMAMTVSWEYVVGWWMPLLLVPFLALWTLLTGVVQHFAQRLRGWPLWAAAAWTLAEALGSRLPFGGFGWSRLAFTTLDQPTGGWLWVIGAAGTGWLVALTGTLLLAVCDSLAELRKPGADSRAPHPLRRGLAAVLGIAVIFAGGAVLGRMPGPVTSHGSVSIAVVQGDVDGSAGPHSMGYARSVTDNHLSETIMAMARARTGLDPMPDFVLWPENSTDMDPNSDAETGDLIATAQQIAGRPVFVGAVTDGPGADGRQTTGLWWTMQGETDRYAKRNAVPFGEFTPMKSLVFALVPMAKEVGRQTVPGTKPGVVNGVLNDGRTLRVGDIICYELAFDSTVYDTVRHGAQVITVQSNNSTYTGTAQPRQQFAITRVRAMEMRRDIVIATTNSLSGVVDGHGKVIAQSTEATAYSRTFTVPLSSGITPAMTVGPLVEVVASVLAGLAAVVGFFLGRGARRGDADEDSAA
ncbi:apolipoprotein N-acyltransferase [Propionibacterium sp.]|uniref:apolipoprotein N-acyltransferase n=1 Tax=Propionibacterium sp. TaxID=1977903 RepID=UPI0039E9BFAB